VLLRARRLVQSAFEQLGYRLIRIQTAEPVFGIYYFFPLLKRLGFAPRHVIDVGANKGNWTRTAFRYFPKASYTLIEPQGELRNYVQDLVKQGCRIQWICAGAADKPGLLPFTVVSHDVSSTFAISQGDAEKAGHRQIAIPVRTLDEIVSSSELPMPEMVKIDTEGFDLKVFRGASSLIGKTEIFLMEVNIREPWENGLAEVIQQMSRSGYRLFDITDLNRSPKFGVLWLMELAFLKDGSRLLDSVTSYE
jgi:FkbM family methyltransferase